MYVCICRQVTDSDIKNAVSNGASSMRLLTKQLDIGMQCGKCCRQANTIRKETLSEQNSRQDNQYL